MPAADPTALLAALRRRPQASAGELAAALGVSVPTVQRLLRQAAPAVVSRGRARRTRHAARRALRGETADLPVYRIDAAGAVHDFAPLALLAPDGSALDLAGSGWPVPADARDGWWAGLPYPLQDLRPQGYLGRQFARAVHAALQLAPDARAWSDDDVLVALSHAGSDVPGDLIVGTPALRRWQAARLDTPAPLADDETLPMAYEALAQQAVANGLAGSSAAGEFPKFAAVRAVAPPAGDAPEAERTPHVLVKFSGAGAASAEARWADLLVAEHLALGVVAAKLAPHGVKAARTRLLRAARTFLESERFDRHGAWGRSPVVSLAAVNAECVGAATHEWPAIATRLDALGLLAPGAAHAIAVLWWFGRLVGNSDMHLGNAGLLPREGRFALAPAYDMLPMRYAPLAGGEAPALAPFTPPLPLPAERAAWHAAAPAAAAFWEALAGDVRASAAMRALAGANAARLASARAAVG